MPQPHLVLSCKENWSHLRSLCILAFRISSEEVATITIIVACSGNIAPRIWNEIARCSTEGDMKQNDLIRVVTLPTEGHNLAVQDEFFRKVWKSLVNEEPIACGYQDVLLPSVNRPTGVILDKGFQISWLEIIREQPHSPPVFQWMMAFSGGLSYLCGSPGVKAREAIAAEEHSCEDLIHIQGLPAMTCRDLHPQDIGAKADKISGAIASMRRFLEISDGLLTTCTPHYDNTDCLNCISDWYSSDRRARPIFHLGPMLPTIAGSSQFPRRAIETEVNNGSNGLGHAAIKFMDRMLALKGPRSVIYVSFGTEHWPSNFGYVEALVDALVDQHLPFIFSYSHSTAVIPSHIREPIETSCRGVFLPFVPQQSILAHQACSWFITHGGANGTVEALSQGIPMIGWPFAVDQPLNVAYLARSLDVAFELPAVRTGGCPREALPVLDERAIAANAHLDNSTLSAARSHLISVLDQAQGPIGARKRKNAESIGLGLASAWAKDGSAKMELDRFLRHLQTTQ